MPLFWESIKVIVRCAWVPLEGTVEWNYQRAGAGKAVRQVCRVQGVTNRITPKPQLAPSEIKQKIEQAFRRSAEVDANRITVEADGSEIILKGTVRSCAERPEAERAAWTAPGVTKVENRIVISP